MAGKIDIQKLTSEHHQALVCLFFAMLPGSDSRYKKRNACYELLQKKFNRKAANYRFYKDAYDAYFDANGRKGGTDRWLESGPAAYIEVYDWFKDCDLSDIEEAVNDIIHLYSKSDSNYMAVRLSEPKDVKPLLSGQKTVTVERLTDLSSELTSGRIVFIALGGDRGKSSVDWDTGFYAVAHVSREPYDIGYSKNKRGSDYFKIDITIDAVLDSPMPRSDFISYPDTYDASFIGLEIHRDRSQAISSLKDDQAVAIIRAVLDKMPHLKNRFMTVFPADFMDRVLGSARVLIPVEINYGEDPKEAVDAYLKEVLNSENEDRNSSLEPYAKDDFLSEVFLNEKDYDLLEAMLLEKKNVLLQGAPGVGKTFMAKRLADSLIGYRNSDQVQMVQFHQSYSYEDFVVGYRPTASGYEIEYGPFYEFCKRAAGSTEPHFFIIDEINRGNVSKIFGELLMLIEPDKRNESLKLLYTREDFSIPENVHLIGMMNTADRSLALIDYALRRRFSFYDVTPAFDQEKFKALISGSVDEQRVSRLIRCVQNLNEAVRTDPALGPGFEIGHSYFCTVPQPGSDSNQNLDLWMKMTVEYELIPLIREYWFDDPDQVEEWSRKLREAAK